MVLSIDVRAESWELAAPFSISRGTKSRADVVVVTAMDGGCEGRGECVPYARYGESVTGTLQAIEELGAACGDVSRETLLGAMPPGAARNAVDCALWDLEARRGRDAGLGAGGPRVARTGRDRLHHRARRARRHGRGCGTQRGTRPLLKIKLGDRAGARRRTAVRAVREYAPDARLIVDANEGWTMTGLETVAPAAAELGVELLEQPLPANADDALAGFDSPVPLGADESLRGNVDLAVLAEALPGAQRQARQDGGD